MRVLCCQDFCPKGPEVDSSASGSVSARLGLGASAAQRSQGCPSPLPGAPAAEDQRKGLEDAVQKLTDAYVKEVDALIKSKSDELTKV